MFYVSILSLDYDSIGLVNALHQNQVAVRAYCESSVSLQLQAVNFFYAGIHQLSPAMPPMAAMSQEMAMDRSAGKLAILWLRRCCINIQ